MNELAPPAARARSQILSVENLQTHFELSAGTLKAVDDVSFALSTGRVLGLVGESGSGKSITGLSIMRLIDDPGRIVGGRIMFDGVDLLSLSAEEMRRLRGSRIAMIFQDPMMTLNPVLRIGTQMVESVLAHRRMPRAQAEQLARDALGMVGIPSPEERLRAYPHQFSGGMRQRVVIAMAFLNEPDLIIADEATTALDVTIQGQILAEVQALCTRRNTALIWITHDLSVVANLADDVSVMYAGRIVEEGPVDHVIRVPRHPYTDGLLRSVPGHNAVGGMLEQIPGAMPSPLALPEGCAFRTRCSRGDAACRAMPAMTPHATGAVRCFHPVNQDEEAP